MHTCHAPDCTEPVTWFRIFCTSHWNAIPYPVRRRLMAMMDEAFKAIRSVEGTPWSEAAR